MIEKLVTKRCGRSFQTGTACEDICVLCEGYPRGELNSTEVHFNNQVDFVQSPPATPVIFQLAKDYCGHGGTGGSFA